MRSCLLLTLDISNEDLAKPRGKIDEQFRERSTSSPCGWGSRSDRQSVRLTSLDYVSLRAALPLAFVLAAGCAADKGATKAPPPQPAATDGVIKRGAAFTLSDEIKLTDVLAAPTKFIGKPVLVSGTVQRACLKKGCWMELKPDGAERGVRVRFKDYGFFVPVDSAGSIAKVEGEIVVKILSEDEAKHLEGEGAEITRNEKGEAVEIGLVATAVELMKASS